MNSANTILFVCLHGAAKSILAEADFRRLAAERGLELSADSAGTEPDPEIAPGVVQALLSEGVDVRDRKPRKITRRDVAGADRVVTFGCDLGDAVAPTARIEHWTDVPAVSDDLPAARAAIRRHLERLITEYVEKGVTP
jgi:protein-tyrosine-phosphatase